jgi:hypothetical protein
MLSTANIPLNPEVDQSDVGSADPDFNYFSHIESIKFSQSSQRAEGSWSCKPCARPQSSDDDLTPEYLENNIAMMVAKTDCGCKHRYCLRKADTSIFDFSKSVEVVRRCRNEINEMTMEEKYSHMMSMFKNAVVSVSHSISKDGLKMVGKVETDFKLAVDDTPGSPKISVCRAAFCKAYGISVWYMDQISSRYKKGEEGDWRSFCDRDAGAKSLDEAESLSKRYFVCSFCGSSLIRHVRHNLDPPLDLRQRQMAVTKNSPQSLHCFVWMHHYFNMFGDHIPNAKDQIHLDPIDKITIYEEYLQEVNVTHADVDPISYPKFLELWKELFPHVSIREYKAVTGENVHIFPDKISHQHSGKCMCCSWLSSLRRQCRDLKRRKLVAELHQLHRSMYMAERLSYYERIKEALDNPDTIMSCISDGMAQNHCELPYLSNLNKFPDTLPQHLQVHLLNMRALSSLFVNFSQGQVNNVCYNNTVNNHTNCKLC